MLNGIERALMFLGVLGLSACTTAIAMGMRDRVAVRASRLGLVGLFTSVTCMAVLGLLNMSGSAPTASGLYLGGIILGWMILVATPLALWVQRVRRSKGWPVEFVSKDAPDA